MSSVGMTAIIDSASPIVKINQGFATNPSFINRPKRQNCDQNGI